MLTLQSELCSICRCVDFDYYISGVASKSLILEPVIPLGLVGDMDPCCSLCKLMIHTSVTPGKLITESNNPSEIICFLRIESRGGRLPQWSLSFYEMTTSKTSVEEYYFSLGVRPGTEQQQFESNRYLGSVSLVKIGGNYERFPWRREPSEGRAVAEKVDLDLFKQLTTGAQSPINSTAQSLTNNLMRPIDSDNNMLWKLSPSFRVIDVQQCCLVKPPPSVHFAALSYVWGKLKRPHTVHTKANHSSLYMPNAINPLDEALPRSIRDAMIATDGLGYRYLWVDALCIVQDAREDKQVQINNMAAIYGLASLTIVAAVGQDADAGLPGVGSTPRSKWQFVFNNGLGEFANKGHDLEQSIGSSYWQTRGWTYQEFAFSSRLLMVTEHEAFFVSAQPSHSLDSSYFWQSESNVSRLQQRGGVASSFTSHVISKPLDAVGLYNNTIETYSCRTLTFQNDVLDAFEGIASYLNQGFRSGFTFGLPNAYLELGLLWFSYRLADTELTRREGFPEYSWVSRTHKVSMKRRPLSTWPSSRLLWRNFSPRQKEWICEDDLMPRTGSEEAIKWRFLPSGSKIEDNLGKTLSVSQPYWEDTSEYPRWQHPRPILSKRLLPPFQPAEPKTGHLHCLAYTIKLHLNCNGIEKTMWRALSGQFSHQGEDDPAGHQHNIEIGEFLMDDADFPNPIELVLLCRFESHTFMPYFERQQSCGQNEELDGNLLPDMPRYLGDISASQRPRGFSRREFEYALLAVETLDGISYRRGVGTMDVSWFHRANPVRRYVVLG